MPVDCSEYSFAQHPPPINNERLRNGSDAISPARHGLGIMKNIKGYSIPPHEDFYLVRARNLVDAHCNDPKASLPKLLMK